MIHNHNDIVLKGQDICYSYGLSKALTGFSIELRSGEILGLLGPNGAGKTTAIRVLTTIFPIDQGQFSVMNIPHTRPQKIRALIGVLSESNGFPSDLTGLEFLIYMGRLYGQTKSQADAKARHLLQLFGLDKKRNVRIATYSRGMRQRLSISRSLINDPKILFLDEPTLGFDPKGQREMLQAIRKEVEEKHTAVILCSHLLEIVEEICNRVMILNHGRIVTQGTVAEIKQRVAPPLTFRIGIAAEAMNSAVKILSALPNVKIAAEHDRVDELVVSLNGTNDESAIFEALQQLIKARIPIESFNRETVRLSDAFLKMIEETQE